METFLCLLLAPLLSLFGGGACDTGNDVDTTPTTTEAPSLDRNADGEADECMPNELLSSEDFESYERCKADTRDNLVVPDTLREMKVGDSIEARPDIMSRDTETKFWLNTGDPYSILVGEPDPTNSYLTIELQDDGYHVYLNGSIRLTNYPRNFMDSDPGTTGYLPVAEVHEPS